MASIVSVLGDVLAEAHRGHKYFTDDEKYQKIEHWTPDLEGDCDDFALWCKQELDNRGIDADLVECLTETEQRHLVCSVDGWVLDNRYRYLMRRDELKYTWLKIGRNGVWYKVQPDDQ